MATATPSHSDAVLDGALGVITGNATTIMLLSDTADAYDAQSTAYATFDAAKLGTATVSFGSATDATSGRKVTVTPAEGNVSATGTGSAYALTNGTDTVYTVGDLSDQVVTSGNTFTIASFDITFADPTSA